MKSGSRMTAREMLESLIAFPTVSASSNLNCVEYIRSYLESHNVSSTLVFNEARDKASLFATVGPMVEGGVVLSGHTDVVPPGEDGWTHSPWKLAERDGRLYGRGTCDMKGFDAIVLAAVPDMVEAPLTRPIHIALSHDEEVGCKGAPALVEAMALALPPPRAVIVGEPTGMQPVIGHKGSLSFYTRVRGHAAHSSRIDTGVSAVMKAARLINWMEDRMEENRRSAGRSDFEPPYTTLHCGMIHGGTAANIVAELCEFVTDIRVIPPEDPLSYRAAYEDFIRCDIEPLMKRVAPESGIEIVERSFVPGLKPERNGSAAALAFDLSGATRSAVVSYGTEAGFFQRAGWSAVVCGPGDIAQAHKADEYLEVSQLESGSVFISRLVDRLSA